MDARKELYDLANKGLTNQQIGERLGLKPQVVSSRISEYRKKNNLPPPNRIKAKVWKGETPSDEDMRAINLEKSKRVGGVLKCPTKFCAGYGINEDNPITYL